MNLCKYLCVSGKLFIRTQIAVNLYDKILVQKCWSVGLGVTHSQKELNSKFAHRRVLNFFQVWLESMQVYKYASLKHSTLLVCMYAWIHYKNVDFEIRYPTLRGPYFCQILINFKNSWHFCNQNFVGFAKMTKSSIQCALEPEKLQKKSVQSISGHPVCMYASMQICMYASMQVWKCATLQVCMYACLHGCIICKDVSMQVYLYSSMQDCL